MYYLIFNVTDCFITADMNAADYLPVLIIHIKFSPPISWTIKKLLCKIFCSTWKPAAA
jgi:hypothetical protein